MKTFLKILFFFLLVTQMSFAQGSWTKVGDMPEIRYAHTVNELNGKIYVVGGASTETSAFLYKTALVYDRSSGEWTQIPLNKNKGRRVHCSCVVDGKLFVIGGSDTTINTNTAVLATMDMFDPNTGVWVSKDPMPTKRSHIACASMDGKIYVMGGFHSTNDLNGVKTLEMYDTQNNTWSTLPDMPTKRGAHSAVAYNGKIYVLGGVTFLPTTVYKTVEVYNPQDSTWTTKSGLMPTARYSLTTCVFGDNIFAIGGWENSADGPIYDKVEVYNPETDEWKTENPLPVRRAGLASLVLDGKIGVYGGSRTNHPLIGTSAIYELSYDDIFATEPYVDKPYARIDKDSVLFRTRFSNIYNHQFTTYLIHANSDSTYLDSLKLFDDGLHGDSLVNDGLYGVFIPPRPVEDFYHLSVSTIDNQTNKYYNTPNRCRFTTAGPIKVDSIYAVRISAQKKYTLQFYLKNFGSISQVNSPSIKVICNDPCVTSTSWMSQSAPSILPGQSVQCNSIANIYYDSASFPGYFNLKFEISSGGNLYWMDTVKYYVPVTGILKEELLPLEYALAQNYPNPFNSTCAIKYSIPKSSQVSLKIFDVLGSEIETLINEEKSGGTYELSWRAANLPSGVYFYRLKAGSFVETKKMILLK